MLYLASFEVGVIKYRCLIKAESELQAEKYINDWVKQNTPQKDGLIEDNYLYISCLEEANGVIWSDLSLEGEWML